MTTERAAVSETEAQQFRRMGWILTHIHKLDPVNRDWLMRRLAEVECVNTRVGRVWTQPALNIFTPRKSA